jgi:membrane protease YdiL (CAAX protease family)
VSQDEQPELDSPRPLPKGQLYRLAWIFYLLLAVAAVAWLGARQGTIPLSLFLRWPEAIVDLGVGIVAGLVLVGLWSAARRAFQSARRLEDELRRMLGAVEPTEVVALALLSGFAEELFFRGAVQGAFGWVAATVLFTVLHTGSGKAFRLWTLFAAIAGTIFAGLVIWRGSLLSAMVAHMLVNAVNLHHLGTSSGSDDFGNE